MFVKGDTVLVLAPHPDDFELGMGATAAKLSDMGVNILVLMLSDRGELTWLDEAHEAAAIIGENVTVETLHLTVFHMANERATLLRSLEQYRKAVPDLGAVFAPASGDMHQDHVTCMNEARRAFKGVTLLGYEILRSNFIFNPQLFIEVEAAHLDRKHQAIAKYHTQRGKSYCCHPVVGGLARARGSQSETIEAEAFEVEWMVCR